MGGIGDAKILLAGHERLLPDINRFDDVAPMVKKIGSDCQVVFGPSWIRILDDIDMRIVMLLNPL